MPDTTGRKKSVLFLTSGLGDNILSLPLAIELEKRFSLTLIVNSEEQAKLISIILPGAKKVHILKNGGRFLSDIIKILLSELGADYWIYPIGACSRSARMLNLLSFAKKKIGFTSLASEKTWQSEIGLDICLTPDLAKSAWRNNLRLLKLIDTTYDERIHEWNDYVASVKEKLFPHSAKVFNGRKPLIFIHPGSNKYPGGLEKFKRWPIYKFIETAKILIEDKNLFEGGTIFLGPSEIDLKDEIQKSIFKENLSNKLKIHTHADFNSELIPLINFLHSHLYFLANDTGLAHISSLIGLPSTIIMSGIDEPAYIGQNGEYTNIVWHPTECRGCTVGISANLAKTFTCLYDSECIKEITVDKVIDSVINNFNKLKNIT